MLCRGVKRDVCKDIGPFSEIKCIYGLEIENKKVEASPLVLWKVMLGFVEACYLFKVLIHSKSGSTVEAVEGLEWNV
jgi:hypothetical protein